MTNFALICDKKVLILDLPLWSPNGPTLPLIKKVLVYPSNYVIFRSGVRRPTVAPRSLVWMLIGTVYTVQSHTWCNVLKLKLSLCQSCTPTFTETLFGLHFNLFTRRITSLADRKSITCNLTLKWPWQVIPG